MTDMAEAINQIKRTEQEKFDDFRLTDEDFFKISRQLEDKHSIFYKFWEIGKPIFTTAIPTAQVSFDKRQRLLAFEFNPIFWNYLDDYTRRFVICHEMLHIILNHGIRVKDASARNHGAINMCLDVVVNHLLVNKFDFDRKKLKGFSQETIDQIVSHAQKNNKKSEINSEPPKGDYRDYCWVDTSFNPKEHPELAQSTKGKILPNDMSFEFYYNLLPKDGSGDTTIVVGEGGGFSGSFDGHEGLVDTEEFEKIMKEIDEKMSPEEKEDLKDMIEDHFQEKPPEGGKKAGTEAGGVWTFVNINPFSIKRKKKWESVIKRWVQKQLKMLDKDKEQWTRVNRRFAMIPKDFFLPTEMETEDLYEDEKKIDVILFFDTSGSCAGYKERFFKAAASIPPNRFNVQLVCFDTKCYKTTLESQKLYGFGGTSYDILETYVQKQVKSGKVKKYPICWVISDGWGDPIHPQYPKNWHWFLTEKYVQYIPKESHIYDLRDFE